MKKRIIAGTLGVLMTFGGTPYISGAEQESDVVFEENFDSLNTGVLTQIGGTELAAQNENITVETDTLTGSKAMKFTVDDEKVALSVPLSPKGWTGKYIYSFSARVENNSRQMSALGVPQIIKTDGSTGSINFTASNKDKLGYYYYDLSKYDKFIKGSDSIDDIMKDKYAKFTYVFDADTRTFDMYRDGVIVARGTKYYYTGGNEIVNLLFEFKNDADYNGTANDGTDKNSGVYWIDDISLKKYEEEDAAGADSLYFEGYAEYIEGAEILVSGDSSAVVAVDPVTYSKALKFSVGTSKLSLSVPLPSKDWTGKYIYTFEARAENNSRWMSALGVPQIIKNDGSYGSINFTGSKKDKLGYYYYDLSMYDKFVRASDNIDDIMKDKYAKFTYIFDADTRTFDMYRDGVLAAKGTKYYYTGGKEVVNLLFTFENNSTYNGTANDGSDQNKGIYWIDNISLATYTEQKDDVSENNMFFEGFTNYMDGLEYSSKENNKAVVTVDPVTNSKALKITVGEHLSSAYGISFPFGALDTVSGGTYKVSYKLRAEKHTRSMERAPYLHHLYNGTDTNCLGGSIKKDFIFYPYQGYGESSGNLADYKDKYVAVDYVVTLGQQIYSIYVDGELKETDARAWTTPQNLYRLYFEFDSDTAMTDTIKPSQSGEWIYWLDDISVEKVPIEAGEPVVKGKNVTIALNMNPTQENVADYVNLTKNGEPVAADIAYADKEITISGLEIGDYTVSIDGLTSVTGFSLTGYSRNFSIVNSKTVIKDIKLTDANGLPVNSITADVGGKLNVQYSAEIADGVENYRVYAIVRNAADRLEAVKSLENQASGTIEIALPDTADETWKIDLYVWDSMTPLAAIKDYRAQNYIVYVSADTEKEGNGSKNAPFSSLEEARAAVSGRANAVVVIEEGTYSFSEPLLLGAADSGVSYVAQKDKNVVFLGGENYDINDFAVSADSRIPDSAKGKVYELSVTKADIGYSEEGVSGHGANALYNEGLIKKISTSKPSVIFDDVQGVRSRYPNEGYMQITEVVQAGDKPGRWNETESGSEYVPPAQRNNPVKNLKIKANADAERINSWSAASEARVDGYWYYDWSDQAMPVKEIQNGVIETAYPSAFTARTGQRFYIYNLLEELDSPGEWFYDSNAEKLFVYPPEGCRRVTVAMAESGIIKIDGADNVTVSGITFMGNNGTAIEVTDSENSVIKDCVVKNVSDCGIWVNGGHNVSVENCGIYGIGGTGVVVSGGDRDTLNPSGHKVVGCDIHDFAQVSKTYNGGVRISGVGTCVQNCRIYNGPHLGIAFSGNDHIIRNNDISAVLKEAADMGAIYAGRSMVNRGTVIEGNKIHDISSSSTASGKYGVYLDDQLSGITVKNNEFYNIAGSGVFVNGGRDNDVSQNSFRNVEESGIILSDWGRCYTVIGTTEFRSSYFGLDKVDYKKAPYTKYPHLATLLDDEPHTPKYNTIKQNTFEETGNSIKLAIHPDWGSDMTEDEMRTKNTIQ